MDVDLALVHIAHCCSKHGCKYGNAECPVAAGHAGAEHPCSYCRMDDEEAAPVVDQIVKWLVTRIHELEHANVNSLRAAHYSDVVRGLREGAWKA